MCVVIEMELVRCLWFCRYMVENGKMDGVEVRSRMKEEKERVDAPSTGKSSNSSSSSNAAADFFCWGCSGCSGFAASAVGFSLVLSGADMVCLVLLFITRYVW